MQKNEGHDYIGSGHLRTNEAYENMHTPTHTHTHIHSTTQFK